MLARRCQALGQGVLARRPVLLIWSDQPGQQHTRVPCRAQLTLAGGGDALAAPGGGEGTLCTTWLVTWGWLARLRAVPGVAWLSSAPELLPRRCAKLFALLWVAGGNATCAMQSSVRTAHCLCHFTPGWSGESLWHSSCLRWWL